MSPPVFQKHEMESSNEGQEGPPHHPPPEKHLSVWGQQCPGLLLAARGLGKESKEKVKGKIFTLGVF